MIDSLHHFLPIARDSRIGQELGLTRGQDWRHFAVLTLHRPSNVDSLETLSALLGAINAIAADVPVIFPVHPRTQQRLVQAGLVHHPQLRLIPRIGDRIPKTHEGPSGLARQSCGHSGGARALIREPRGARGSQRHLTRRGLLKSEPLPSRQDDG